MGNHPHYSSGLCHRASAGSFRRLGNGYRRHLLRSLLFSLYYLSQLSGHGRFSGTALLRHCTRMLHILSRNARNHAGSKHGSSSRICSLRTGSWYAAHSEQLPRSWQRPESRQEDSCGSHRKEECRAVILHIGQSGHHYHNRCHHLRSISAWSQQHVPAACSTLYHSAQQNLYGDEKDRRRQRT